MLLRCPQLGSGSSSGIPGDGSVGGRSITGTGGISGVGGIGAGRGTGSGPGFGPGSGIGDVTSTSQRVLTVGNARFALRRLAAPARACDNPATLAFALLALA